MDVATLAINVTTGLWVLAVIAALVRARKPAFDGAVSGTNEPIFT
jgi:hypothetical protein